MRSQRVVRDDDEAMEAEVITPLSGPNYGPFARVKRRWRKPVPAIIADAIANCQGLSERLTRGMYTPGFDNVSHCKDVYQQLCRQTDEQLKALEAFAKIDWRE
jgi:hypothetical protein